MDRDPGEEGGPRELRLEGLTLMIAGGVLAALLFGAFQLGRMVERWNAPPRSASAPSGAGGGADEAVDSTEKLTFFDTLSGGGKEAEPAREAAKPTPPAAPPAASTTPGSWFVQVFVGRDRDAAEEVVRTLRGKGYPVRTDVVAEGASGSLYKVRVGGFATKEAAESGAARLHQDGQASTWVVKPGG
ncbi:MAG TPA: SPOR domain-containing protein [Candidatus Polarisedimenticolaceae bacterium]|nr:SPOR domain-containing protein [Candidatus Polarisedimenticolaceae bacterium]